MKWAGETAELNASYVLWFLFKPLKSRKKMGFPEVHRNHQGACQDAEWRLSGSWGGQGEEGVRLLLHGDHTLFLSSLSSTCAPFLLPATHHSPLGL